MATARSQLISLSETPYYHCMARCVRRAYLCGEDSFTGQSYEHRRQWIVEKLTELAQVYAMDICAYAVMSNHYHVVLKVAGERAVSWSEREVAERWLRLFKAPLVVERYLANETADAETAVAVSIIAGWRQRLSDISWFMRCLNESIARRANSEDKCTGRFWEGRFKSQALLDETALLTCMAYVDLNPIRAGEAATPETSEYTSLRERLRAFAETVHRRGRPSGVSDLLIGFSGTERYDQPAGIAFDFHDYLTLVDATGRAILNKKSGAIAAELAPILQRLGVDESQWLENIQYFGQRFHRAVGPVDKLRQLSQSLNQRWCQGIQASREFYFSPSG